MAHCIRGGARQGAHGRQTRCPLPHAMLAPLCSAQLSLSTNQIGAAGAAELAKALATNHTLTAVCLVWHTACAVRRGGALIDVGCDAHCPTLCLLHSARRSSLSVATKLAMLALPNLRRFLRSTTH